MRRLNALVLLLLFVAITIPETSRQYTGQAANSLEIRVYDLRSQFPTYYAVDIPWYRQGLAMSCGAAALRSSFGELGWTLNESEIRIAAEMDPSDGILSGDMIRAAHFSNSSEMGVSPKIRGYTGKPYGTDSFEICFNAGSPSSRQAVNEFLERCLFKGQPVILLTSYQSGGSAGHYRVLCGYDERTGMFVFTDSLRIDPETGSNWTVSYSSLYQNYWPYSGYWAQVLSPWTLELTPLDNPAPSSSFRLAALIDTGIPSDERYALTQSDVWALGNMSVRLQLPFGYTLLTGSLVTSFDLNSSGMAQVYWTVQSPSSINKYDSVSAYVTGLMAGNGTHPWARSSFNYTDAFYAEKRTFLSDWSTPEIGNLSVTSGTNGNLNVSTSLVDESPLASVQLEWRTQATNWTTADMVNTESSTWLAAGISPAGLSESGIFQFRITAADQYNNTLLSPVYECDYSGESSSIADNTTLTIEVAVGVASAAAVLVVMLRRRGASPRPSSTPS